MVRTLNNMLSRILIKGVTTKIHLNKGRENWSRIQAIHKTNISKRRREKC